MKKILFVLFTALFSLTLVAPAANAAAFDYDATSAQPVCYTDGLASVAVTVTRDSTHPTHVVTVSWADITDATLHSRSFHFKGKTATISVDVPAGSDVLFKLSYAGSNFFESSYSQLACA